MFKENGIIKNTEVYENYSEYDAIISALYGLNINIQNKVKEYIFKENKYKSLKNLLLELEVLTGKKQKFIVVRNEVKNIPYLIHEKVVLDTLSIITIRIIVT
ncbi:hypothetical protein JXJ21_13875, partial [candidate division KSB1 bacterium]|nr:hypothetical protein [candidate division KSB1 bacterium]